MTTMNFEQQVGNVVVNGILTENTLKVKINGVDERMTEWSAKYEMTPIKVEDGYMIFPIEEFECTIEELTKCLNENFELISKELVAKALDSAKISLNDKKEYERIANEVAYDKYAA